MNIQKIPQNNIAVNKDNAPNFKGGTAFLRYLATNQAVGANAVDLSFMVIPRTTSDFIGRGPNAGIETGRREASGTLNHSLVGVYGIGAGALVGALTGINRKYGINANKIMAAPTTINILAENKARQLQNNKSQLDYIKETLSNVKAFNPNSEHADAKGYVKLSKKSVDKVSEFLNTTINDIPNMKRSFFKKDDLTKAVETAVNMITEDTAAQSKYILESLEGSPESDTNLKTLLDDICKTSDAFNKEKVVDSFKNQIKDGKKITDNKFVKSLTKFKNTKSIAGFLIAAGIGASIQPLNMYLTKKKTGIDGFVGVEGRTKDNSNGFKALKVATSVGFGAMVMKTLETGFKGFFKEMAFTGFWPSIPQLKGVYGITIISRLLAARDKDELRESLTKDTLGFLSWLVLGDVVNRMVAEAMDSSVLNRKNKEVQNKKFLGRAYNSTLKNRDEIIIEALTKNGISATKEENGKTVAKSFKELFKDLKTISDKTLLKTTKKRLRTLNWAQCAGYLVSGAILGFGIPNFNMYVTNKLDKRRKAKAAALQAQ